MRKILALIGAIAALGMTSVVHAASVSWSASSAPPAVNNADIASFTGTNNDGGNVMAGDDDGTFLTQARPGQGQLFITGSDTNGYYLNAVTLQHVKYNSPLSMDSGWTGFDGSVFEVKVGTMVDGVFTIKAFEVTANLGAGDADSPGYNNNSGPKGSFLTLTFDNPVYLYPNTTNGFSVWITGGAYMEVNGKSTSTYGGAGEEAYSEAGGAISLRGGDRVFHCDMIVSPDGPPPPPPAATYEVLPTTDPVQTVDISGTWNFTPNGGSQTTIQVPGGGWYKQGFTTLDEADYETTISVPNVSSTQRTVLEFGAVNFEATLFVDNVEVGTRVQAWTPASWDISDYVTPGSSHTIRVHVKGMAARMSGTKSLDPNGAGSWAYESDPKYSFLAQGIFRSAELKIYPEVYIKDVFVRTSVTDSALYYDVTLCNESTSSKTVTLSGNLDSWNGDSWNYPSLPTQSNISVPAGTNMTVTVGPVAWNLGTASYWWPNVPYQEGYQAKLHNLNLSLSGASTHSTTTRFGFREITQGPDGLGNTCYFLNGTRVNFRGDNLQGANYDRIDYNGQGDAYDTYPGFTTGWSQVVDNYLRLNMSGIRIHQIPAAPYMLDICDEMGLMIENETGIRGAGAQQDFNAGRANMVNHVKALFARDRNHAAVMRLSLCNEPDWAGASSEFILDLYDAAQTVDQTRPYAVDTGATSYDDITYGNFSVFPHYGASHSEWGNYTDEVYARPDRPYGCGEFIWDSDNTKPGFTWFGTATAAMRAKGASDTRPYTLLSAWASLVPGTKTSDMRLENPPWNSATLYPLYGADNLPDPWSNYQIKRVQAGFDPNLVMDAGYWAFNKTSNGNGDWPAAYEMLAPSTLTTRTLNIFNDAFSGGTAIDVSWELRQGSRSGTLLDSGVVNASVPYGYVGNENISFTTPNAPDGTLLYLVLSAKKGGVEVFREDDQCFLISTVTSYGGLTNPDFEEPAYNGKLANGFDEVGSDPNGTYEVPGWTDINLGAGSDSGIESPGNSQSGSYSAFMMGDYEWDGYPSDPNHGMYTMTGYTIQSGDSITLTFWTKIDAADDPGWVDVTCRLFGGSNPSLRTLSETRFGAFQGSGTPLADTWEYRQISLSSAQLSAQVGQELGIAFFNGQYFWSQVDNVKLYINQTPPDFIPPHTPSGLVATPGNNSVSLDWDNNSDSIAGYNVYRSINPGGPYLTLATGLGSSNFTDNNAYNGVTYYYVVSALDSSGLESRSGEAMATPSEGSAGGGIAIGETAASGTVAGGIANTYSNDNIYESITEVESGGNPNNRYSYLEHRWTFDISGANPVLNVEAHHTANSEGDDFIFAYSTDGNNYTDAVTVTKSSDNDTPQTYALPGGVTGTVYVRVKDANQTAGRKVLDTIYVDQLYISTESVVNPDTTPPAVPTGLSATAGEGYVALDWNDNSELDLAGYTVYRSTSSGSGYTAIASGVVSSSFADNSVVNGTTYYYVVTASDAFSNESGFSAEASASGSSDATPPAAPTGLVATGADGSAVLDWSNNSEPDLASYTVYRSTTSGSGYSVVASGLASSAYTDSTVVNGTTYYYVVTATDGSSNESGYSSEALVIPAVPVALANADFEAGVVNYPTGFDTPTDVPGWIDYSISDAGVEGGSAWWGTHNNSYSAFMAPSDGAYLLSGYTIQSGDEFALSFAAKAWYGGSSEWTVTLFYDNPANVIGTFVTGTSGSWEQYAPAATITATAGSVGGTLGILFVNTGAEYGTLDDVTLSVVSSGPPDTTPPAAPAGLGAVAGDSSVSLDWADNGEPDLASYTVYRSTTSGSGYGVIAAGLASSTYTDNTVVNGMTYYYVVTATDTSSNESGNSAEVSATPQVAVPSAPTGLNASAVLISQINLSWSASGGATGYNVKWSANSGGPYTTIATDWSSTSYSDTGMFAGSTNYYVVSAVNVSGESADSAEASAVTPELVAHLAFDETSGTVASDSSPNGFDGTLVNGPLWATGLLTNSVLLDGVDDYVSLPAGVVADVGEFTIATWVYLNSVSSSARVFDFGSDTTTNMFLTPQGGSGVVSFGITTSGGGGEEVVDGTAALPTNAWTHVAVTWSAGTGILYVDGVSVGSNNAMTLYPALLGNTLQNYIGQSQYPDPYLDGAVDDFRIIGRALSAAEIAVLATPPPGTGPADDYAGADLPVSGTVSGSYAATQASDNSYETITEIESGGKPSNRYSYLEHKWTVNVTGGDTVTFNVEAYKTANSEGDNFVFAYSTDDVNYTDMVTITKTADDNAVQSYALPGSLSGTVYIRVTDTDHSQGNRTLDSVFVDQLFVHSE